ncbi:MAG TPA: ABC transporter substrate-binding protein [Gaiellaceae bacterium]|nr:ABC transporter substrate-binding protein [Gaiellaceae bacterium]
MSRLVSVRALTVLGVCAVAVTLSLAGAVQARTDQARITVDYATSFGNFGRDAYIYVAIERGYMRDAGFDVNVTPGTGSVDNIKLVAAGRLDYSPVDIGALVVTRANERLPTKVVSVVHQNTMSAIFTLAESNITTPKQLEGKTLADSPASTVRILFPLYAKKAGIDASKVQWRDAAPPALPALLATKQVDGIGQFSAGIPLAVKAAGGRSIRTHKYSKVLPGLLGIGVIASDEKIQRNPGEVRRFVRALNRGLRWAIDNPGAAGAILQKYQPLADPVTAAQELRIMKFFVQTKPTRRQGYGIGYIDRGKIASTISVIANGFRLERRLTPTELYSSVAVPVRTAR